MFVFDSLLYILVLGLSTLGARKWRKNKRIIWKAWKKENEALIQANESMGNQIAKYEKESKAEEASKQEEKKKEKISLGLGEEWLADGKFSDKGRFGCGHRSKKWSCYRQTTSPVIIVTYSYENLGIGNGEQDLCWAWYLVIDGKKRLQKIILWAS